MAVYLKTAQMRFKDQSGQYRDVVDMLTSTNLESYKSQVRTFIETLVNDYSLIEADESLVGILAPSWNPTYYHYLNEFVYALNPGQNGDYGIYKIIKEFEGDSQTDLNARISNGQIVKTTVGDELNLLKNAVAETRKSLYKQIFDMNLWERGGWNGANASSSSSQNYIRTKTYLSNDIVGIKIKYGYQVSFLAFSQAGDYLGIWSPNKNSSGKNFALVSNRYISGPVTIYFNELNPNYKYKLNITTAPTVSTMSIDMDSHTLLVNKVDRFVQDVVLVQSTEPTSEFNRIWLPTQGQFNEVTVPTYDEFSQLSEEIGMLANLVGESVSWEIGTEGRAQNWDNGGTGANEVTDITKYTDISKYKFIRYMAFASSASNTAYGIAFYTEKTQGTYVSGVQGYSNSSGMREQWAKVPNGAVYARFTVRKDFEGFFIEGYENLPSKIIEAEANIKGIISDVVGYPYEFSKNIYIGTINTSGKTANGNARLRLGYTRVVPNYPYNLRVDSDYQIRGIHGYSSDNENSWTGIISPTFESSTTFKVPEGTNYIRAVFHDAQDDTRIMTDADIEAIKPLLHLNTITTSIITSNTKKNKTGDFEFFTVNVDRPLPFNDEAVTTDSETVECVLRLPSSYMPYGKPTRLIFMAHGAHGYIDAANDHWYSANWKWLCNQLLAAGYAVFDANTFEEGTTDPNVIGYGLGGPLYINVVKKAYDYIQDNYNVYEQIFCHGTSMGGVGATHFAHAYPHLVLAESSFAGRDVLFYVNLVATGSADQRFPAPFGYADMTSLEADKFSHVEGMSPSLTLRKVNADGTVTLPPDRETDYTAWKAFWSGLFTTTRTADAGRWIGVRKVPYKAWNSWLDNANSTKLEETLQKAYSLGNACPYYVVNYETGTHDDMCFGKVNDMANQLISWYKRWE